MTYTRTCPICGTRFEARRRDKRCCCNRCAKLHRYRKYGRHERVPEVSKACEHCGVKFTTRRRQKRFCSAKCSWRKRYPPRCVGKESLCDQCLQPYTVRKGNQRYCRRRCCERARELRRHGLEAAESIAQRAAAVRKHWDERTRLERTADPERAEEAA